MSFNINSDKEFVRGQKPTLIGDQELTIRAGTGSAEKEIFRAQLDEATDLPRVGINRTGERVNVITITAGGAGYTTPPSVNITAPDITGGIQALASAFIFNGQVVNIAVNNPGSGYSTAPSVSISGGNGGGATATAELDTVDFELDINGAIRTSTSIISDTARILNLDIDNFITPDANFRAPNLKTFANNTGSPWSANVIIQKNNYKFFGANIYQALNTGQTGSSAPVHVDGEALNGEVNFKHIGFRANDASEFGYNTTGDSGVFPRSITPLLGDRSDKIATTEYVLNLATNDVGGRVYVSAQIGSDLNDGRSAVNPVRTIKKAAQLAWETPGVKETIIVSGGDYVEDNPISLPPDASIVGDNLRLVIMRPANPGKHMVKFGDKNYVIGVTYRDQVDSVGDAVATWDFAMVFDDKQKVVVDVEANGDAGVKFPVGHQIFGPDQFRVDFQENTGGNALQTGLEVVGVNTGSRARIIDVTFDNLTGSDAFLTGKLDVTLTSGSFLEGERFNYLVSGTVGTSISLNITQTDGANKFRVDSDPDTLIPPGTFIHLNDTDNSTITTPGFYQVKTIDDDNEISGGYWIIEVVPILGAKSWDNAVTETINISGANIVEQSVDTTTLKSIRAEGEVVEVEEDLDTALPLQRIDFSLQGDPTIATGGFQNAQFGNAEDLGGVIFYTNELVGRSNIHNYREGQEVLIEGLPTSAPDLSMLNGKQRIYKILEDADGRSRRFVIPKKLPAITDANFDPGQFATVKSFSKTITLSLLNSPNKFPLSTPVERRFQDACVLLRNNREFIADEVLGRVNDEFKSDYFRVYDVSANDFKIYLGTNDHVNTYVSGGTVKFGGSTYNVTDFIYDYSVTGVATITTSATITGLQEDSMVQIADILISCASGTKVYPSYSAPTSGSNTGDDGDNQCKQDVIHFVNALVRDLEFGTNHNIIEGSKKYIIDDKIEYIEDEIVQNIRAIEYTRQLCILAMRNWRTGNGTTGDPVYTPKYSSVTRYFDTTIINTTAGNPVCANVRDAINTLAYLWVDVISNEVNTNYIDGGYLIARNADLIADQAYQDTKAAFPALGHNNIEERKCPRDIKYTLKQLLRDLVIGGNHGIVSAAETYYSGNVLTGVPVSEVPAVSYAYQRAKTYAIAATRNWTNGSYVETTPTGALYTASTGAMDIIIPDPLVMPTTGDRIAFKEGSLTFSCTYGGGGNDSYPRESDPNFGRSVEITNVQSSGGSTTITCNVGAAGVASGDTHTFVSAAANGTILVYDPTVLTSPIPKFEDWDIPLDSTSAAPSARLTPSNATYDPANGDFTITSSGHSVTTGNSIRLSPRSFAFTCDMDGNASTDYLPESGQIAYGNSLAVTSTTSDTFTVNVGASGPDQQWTPTDATYNPATGELELTVGAGHGMSPGVGIVIDDNSLSFTCTMDGNDSTKTYPRPSEDKYSGRSVDITAVGTNTITVNVGASPADKTFQPTDATYDPVTGDMVVTIGQHGLGVNKNIVLGANGLSFTCDMDDHQSIHSYPRSTDPQFGKSVPITNVGLSKHTVSNAAYDATAGKITLTVTNHPFINGDFVKLLDNSLTFNCALDRAIGNHTYVGGTVTNIYYTGVDAGGALKNAEAGTTYDPLTGELVIAESSANNSSNAPVSCPAVTDADYNTTTGTLTYTFASAHGLNNGQWIKIPDNSLSFSCTYGGGVHKYVSGTVSNAVTIGTRQYDVTDATYNANNGALELTIGAHSYTAGVNTVTIGVDKLGFTCDADNHLSTHYYPRSTDPSYNQALAITGQTATTITVNVGAASGSQTKTYPRSSDPVSGRWLEVYDVTSTELTVRVLDVAPSTNTDTHTFVSATSPLKQTYAIKFQAANVLDFTCDADNNATVHSYPRNDTEQGTVTNGAYEPTTGVMTLTIAGHGWKNGDYVKIADDSLTFSCPFGGATGAAAEKTYPRSTDPVSDKWLRIWNVTADTFDVQVLETVPSTNIDPHTFVTASANGVTWKKDYAYDQVIPVDAVTATSVTINVSAASAGHTYPRTNFDYVSNRWLEISNVSGNDFDINVGASTYTGTHTFVSATLNGLYRQTGTITFNVGAAGAVTAHDVSDATYNTVTGDLELQIGAHTLSTGTNIKLEDDSLTFGCQAAVGQHLFVSTTGFDDSNGNTWSPTAATYTPASGDLVFVMAGHTMTTSDTVTLGEGCFTFTCDADGHATNHAYPRTTDPAYNTPLAITNVNGDSVTINVGASTSTQSTYPRALQTFTATTGTTYTPATGVMSITTTAPHGLSNGDKIKFNDQSLVFSCNYGDTGNGHYPRVGDPLYNTYVAVSNVTANTFEVNALQGTTPTNTDTHTFVSATADGIKKEGNDYVSGKSIQIQATTSTSITINVNGGQGAISVGSAHTFISATGGAVKSGGNYNHRFSSATATAIGFYPQAAHTFVTAANNCVKHLPQSAHTFVRADTNSVQVYTTGQVPACANVASSIITEMDLLNSILIYETNPNGGIEPGATTQTFGTLYDTNSIISYPNNFIYDQNNVRMAIRADYDDYPIIEASPYTQNASVISFLGGGGALVDGSKVKQPNCPFPGLELDGTASFPNQGKSMVASAFTIVSFGGTGYKIIEDGYVQLVSVFVIFCADGVLAESGGYASITNSATNFGIYALRGRGFRDTPYSFDKGIITNVSSTPTGRTILTVGGLGREPLEHYVVKINGFSNVNADIEFFVDTVSAVTVGPPFSAQLTLDNGTGDPLDVKNDSTGQAVSASTLLGESIDLHRPSIVNSSSHTWEFAGSGTNYLALPENGGTKTEAFEQVSQEYGRVYVSGTDELGDFKVGTFARIENRTGAITFTGTVTISEVEFLKLKGGDVVVTGFDNSNTLGGANATDSKLPTQKAVRDYITNNLGPYINKPYSTNAVPRALVELTDSGKISIDQIPALRPFEVFTVPNIGARLALEGALAGDICIQQDTTTSFILNNDLDSQFLGFTVDTTLQFTIGDIFDGSITNGRLQATEYRQGVVYQLNITNGGSGYASPPTVTITGGAPQAGSVECKATSIIANGEVVALEISTFNGFKGGKGFTTQPTVTIAAPAGSGTQAQGNALIESRLYGDIVNKIKLEDTDFIDSSDSPPVSINILRVVNTSASDANNWVSLSSNQIAAGDIVSGTMETDRLASSGAANSFTYLRGDQNWALAVQSLKGAERRYFAKLTSACNSGSSEMVFATLQDALIGHEVKNLISGIQPNTNITGVLTTGGSTSISLNNPVTQTIPAGSIIEFERGASPITFESTYTQGNFVDDLIISNGGSGFTNGQFFDQPISGGSGTGLKGNVTVSGGSVTEIVVTDGGAGYSADFTVTIPPTDIGGGSGLILLAKISTVNRQYANVSLDVQRVSDLTISSDLYGTIGVARFKKSQFNIGVSGNGSVDLNVGADSGLDADLLDGQQGEYYTNASNLFSGTIPSDRMSGSYNISVSGSSGNTLRLATGTNNPTSNPSPDNFVGGIVSNTINNNANLLSDGGTKNMVLTLRSGGTSFDASFGGVRQLAFTDNDNMWMRGSGTGVTSFGSWAKMWSSINDGAGSGLDADKLDNKQGSWYQNALNINDGTISDNRLPRFISATVFRDDLTIKSYNGDPKYRIYVSGEILNTTPFTPGSNVNLYNAVGQGTGTIAIDNIIVNDDTQDNFNDFTIIVGRLTTGNFTGAVTIGTASNRKEFDDFTIEDGNTIQVAKLESDGGTANLRLGRKDGTTSSPGVYFNSSQLVANYNAAIVATGGNATDASGGLNFLALDSDAVNINGNVIWNAGNITFQSSNVASTAVKRDASGNFSAGTITATLTGSASLNVLKAGDTMTGSLSLTGASSNLSISGTSGFTGKVTLSDDLQVATDTFYVDVSAEKVGINAGSTPDYSLDIRGTTGLFLGSATNAAEGSRITFSDNVSGGGSGGQSYGQYGYLKYKHSDSTTPNSEYGSGFYFESSEELVVKVEGDILASRYLGIGIDREPDYTLEVNGDALINATLNMDNANDNGGARINFRGASSYRNFVVGNQIVANHLFTIQASTNNGGTTWNTTPAFTIDGSTNRVAINTTATSGVDPDDGTTNRNYQLNIEGDVNFNGGIFQNNSPFVTSRWTASPNGNDIYRASKVGINFSSNTDPTEALDVEGNIDVTGTLKANGQAQWLDSYGVIKLSLSTINENVTIPSGTNGSSIGPITVGSGNTVYVQSGANWIIT
tara:strand:- start:7788 stop:20381 length:12594 start_codon:yes stop_codon:yes gene_type:complete